MLPLCVRVCFVCEIHSSEPLEVNMPYASQVFAVATARLGSPEFFNELAMVALRAQFTPI